MIAMTFYVPDDILKQSGLDEREMMLELACRLYDIGRLDLNAAARMAKVDRFDFENALRIRKMPLHRPTLEDLADEAAALEKFREMRRPA
jgi:predicted HTH domain antitoxin